MSDINSIKKSIITAGGQIPLSGSGKNGRVLKADLIKYLNQLNTMNITDPSERILFNTNPELYEQIKILLPTIPDPRPTETLKKMKSEVYNPWSRLVTELTALSRDDTDAAEERELLDTINQDDPQRIEYYIGLPVIKRFLINYPTLSWVLARISSHNIIYPLLISEGNTQLLPSLKINKIDIKYIPDAQTAELLYQENKNIYPVSSDEWTQIIKRGYLGEVLWALLSGIDPSENDNEAIKVASRLGYVDIVRVLLDDSRVDPAAARNTAIRDASEMGHVEIVKLLLKDPRVDPTMEGRNLLENLIHLYGQPLTFAVQKGHTEVVKLLLNDARVDPTALDDVAIKVASINGNTDVVRVLLEDGRANPASSSNYALRIAASSGYISIVKLLLSNPRVDPSADNNAAFKAAKEHNNIIIINMLKAHPKFRH